MLAILADVIIHKLIHAFFFKLFKPKSKVEFGINWKLGAAYATCPKVTYDRRQMIIISLAPFIIWSLTLTILFGMNLLSFLPMSELPAYMQQGVSVISTMSISLALNMPERKF